MGDEKTNYFGPGYPIETREVRLEKELEKLTEETTGLKRMIKTINDRVIPGEMDSTDSFRQIVDEHRKLTEENQRLRDEKNKK